LKPTILLVEDNASDEKLARLALGECGIPHELVVARDGAAALDMLAEGLEPTVVLLDLRLPRVDGLEVLRRIRADERNRRIPVVVLTASREEEDVASSYALGANAYVRKSLDYGDFADATRTIAQFWLVLNERPATR
jgi:CheY-like chemotaxis protein